MVQGQRLAQKKKCEKKELLCGVSDFAQGAEDILQDFLYGPTAVTIDSISIDDIEIFNQIKFYFWYYVIWNLFWRLYIILVCIILVKKINFYSIYSIS